MADLRADRRERLRQTYRCDTAYNSLDEMLRGPDNLDAVGVFSGAPDHFAHVSLCMRHGLRVICAVPAVMTLEQAQRLRELEESTGLRYMMAETSYARQPCIYARNLHAVEGFGELHYSNSSTTTTGAVLTLCLATSHRGSTSRTVPGRGGGAFLPCTIRPTVSAC